MKLIFSADDNWGIGSGNKLLFRAKADMARFKELTTGNVVVMGRATLESLPGSKPLPNRVNIALTSNPNYRVGGVITLHSKEELFETLKSYNDGDIFVIGGEAVYRMLLPYCDTAYVTRFFAEASADRFMPDFDNLDGWRLTERSGIANEDGLAFRFDAYMNDSPRGYK